MRTLTWCSIAGRWKLFHLSKKRGGLPAVSRTPLLGQVSGPEKQIGEIYQLQAAFHLAKSAQNIDLMMSLWDVDGSLTIPGDPKSLVPSFKMPG